MLHRVASRRGGDTRGKMLSLGASHLQHLAADHLPSSESPLSLGLQPHIVTGHELVVLHFKLRVRSDENRERLSILASRGCLICFSCLLTSGHSSTWSTVKSGWLDGLTRWQLAWGLSWLESYMSHIYHKQVLFSPDFQQQQWQKRNVVTREGRASRGRCQLWLVNLLHCMGLPEKEFTLSHSQFSYL